MNFFRRNFGSASQPPPQDSLKATKRLKLLEKNWQIISKELSMITDPSNTDVADTAIPHHLTTFCFLVCEEAQENEAESTRPVHPQSNKTFQQYLPCIDFLIFNNVLETLVSMTISDCPKNITTEVAKAYEYLLKSIPSSQ
eukprot:Sdes_comp10683_c1_seq1m2380